MSAAEQVLLGLALALALFSAFALMLLLQEIERLGNRLLEVEPSDEPIEWWPR